MNDIKIKISDKFIKQREYFRNAFCQNQMFDTAVKDIMIIDDCQDTLVALRKMLTMYTNHNVTVFSSEYDAFERFSKCRPDLVIMDINLKNINGIKFYSVLKALSLFSLPILFISKDRSQIENILDLNRGDTSFLPKPIKKEGLMNEINFIFSAIP